MIPSKSLYILTWQCVQDKCPLVSIGGEGNGTPLQYSCLENPMDRGAWWAAVHGVARSRTQLSDLTFTFCFHALEKEIATHSSVLAWRVPGTAELGGLLSLGPHRVGHDWSDLAVYRKTLYKIWKNICKYLFIYIYTNFFDLNRYFIIIHNNNKNH